MTNIAGISMEKYCQVCEDCQDWENQKKMIVQEVRESAYHIINYKGSTHYAIGMALLRITETILRNQQSILSISTLLDGEFGLTDVCLSVPCILSGKGVKRIVQSPLSVLEMDALRRSASILADSISQIK
jgi:L-lactate dehydrogenase